MPSIVDLTFTHPPPKGSSFLGPVNLDFLFLSVRISSIPVGELLHALEAAAQCKQCILSSEDEDGLLFYQWQSLGTSLLLDSLILSRVLRGVLFNSPAQIGLPLLRCSGHGWQSMAVRHENGWWQHAMRGLSSGRVSSLRWGSFRSDHSWWLPRR